MNRTDRNRILYTKMDGNTSICSHDWCMVSPYWLDAGDALGVVPAKNELLHHLGDPLDSESAIDDGVFAFVLFSDALKIELEQQLNGVDSTRPVHRLCEVGKRKGGLSMHIEVQRGDYIR